MKKLIFLLVIAITLFSCSNDKDDTLSENSSLLQKVIFYEGQSNEAHWYFNSKGLLSEIKSPDGTLVEKFSYNSQNNVINDTKYGNGAAVYNITYNSINVITKINNENCTFNTASKEYSFLLNNSPIICKVNNEMLVTKNTSTYTNSIVFVTEMTYQNGNMTSYDKSQDGSSIEYRSFGFGNISNPLKNGILPVLKLKSLIDPSFFIEGISSVSLVENVHFENGSPLYFNYGFLTYENGRVEKHDREVYNGTELEFFYTFARYYYKGQTIP